LTSPTPLAVDAVAHDPEALVARLAALDDADERTRMLAAVALTADQQALRTIAERLKDEADRARYHDADLARRWCADVVTLGRRAEAPSIVALGRMVEALLLYDQGRHLDSLVLFDEAGALARSAGDEVGWARVQIGRIGPCRALGRFDEALRRADEARAILETAGERLRAASIDNNLAMLLDQMGRPADALAYSERALTTYRATGPRHVALMLDTLANHALLLWRLGHVRAALQAHQEARDGYGALGAAMYAAREDLNIGTVYLALGHYATAMGLLASARHDLRAAGLAYPAAQAGLYSWNATCAWDGSATPSPRRSSCAMNSPAARPPWNRCGRCCGSPWLARASRGRARRWALWTGRQACWRWARRAACSRPTRPCSI